MVRELKNKCPECGSSEFTQYFKADNTIVRVCSNCGTSLMRILSAHRFTESPSDSWGRKLKPHELQLMKILTAYHDEIERNNTAETHSKAFYRALVNIQLLFDLRQPKK